MLEAQQRSFPEINDWGQIIPKKHIVSLDIFGRCIEAINQHFQYPPFFTALIGFYILLTIEHWTDKERSCLKDPHKINQLQKQTEDTILLGWNERNSDATVGVGQLDTLIKTLNVMSRMCNPQNQLGELCDVTSTICSMLENQWIKQSSDMLLKALNTYQYDNEIVHCLIDMAQFKYDSFHKHKGKLNEIFKLRMETFMKNFGDFKVESHNLQTLAMLCSIKDSSFQNLKESIAWQMGSSAPNLAVDHFGIASMPVNDILGLFKSSGNFVKRNHLQFSFNQVVKQITQFIRKDDIFHLFMMSLLFDNTETRDLQNQYQYLLVKKLSENNDSIGAENGDHAFCIMKSCFSEYMKLTERFASYAYAEAQEKKKHNFTSISD